MSLGDLTDRTAVIKAAEEFDRLGRDAFLRKYGFGPATRYFLLYQGARYDSKAIAGVAYGYQYPDQGPLRPGDFSGGDNTVVKRLRALGFEVSTTGYAPRDPTVWALSANPKRYRIGEAVKKLEYDHWTIGRSDIRAGDSVIIWQTRDNQGRRGIVGLGQVMEDPRVRSDETNPYWTDPNDGIDPQARVLVRYLSAPYLPLWIDDSPIGEFLASLKPARAQGGTVSRVTEAQWQRILELAGNVEPPSLDEIEAEEALKPRATRSGGQGFGLNAKERSAVEQHAMDLAMRYLAERWNEVQDVSSTASFDLLCRRGADELCVEVKGTTTQGEKVILTKNEVAKASEDDYALFVVSEIDLVRDSKRPEARGGVCTFFWPWDQEAHELEPIAYSCRLDWSGGERVEVMEPDASKTQ